MAEIVTQSDGCKYKCSICDKQFKNNAHLTRHLDRKTSCALIHEPSGASISCKYCNKEFASKPSMARHVKNFCKIANSEDGMEKLFEHTLQSQLAEQNAELLKRVDQLTELVKTQFHKITDELSVQNRKNDKLKRKIKRMNAKLI